MNIIIKELCRIGCLVLWAPIEKEADVVAVINSFINLDYMMHKRRLYPRQLQWGRLTPKWAVCLLVTDGKTILFKETKPNRKTFRGHARRHEPQLERLGDINNMVEQVNEFGDVLCDCKKGCLRVLAGGAATLRNLCWR
ncbi:hypothetical protein FJT64_010990 [Amphibalanus amphitrite]|uniref:Uncharacterized protein n=1 Tax=Amphibalanus amphitrite TaxID=1232801 RepID=A0A6A4V8B3_AMPAM|nr:hypothetical protein FJT64_010990 [Amphibalanus amphitrite]